MDTQPLSFPSEPLPITCTALDAAYALNSQVSLKVTAVQYDVEKVLTFSTKMTVGQAADQAAQELGIFMASPTFVDPSGYVHRRETGLVCMIHGENVHLASLVSPA